MQFIDNFKLFESTITQDPRIRSERLLTQAQIEYPKIESLLEDNEFTNVPTIVFTDIVGSSEMWSSDPVEMMKQLKSHHELVNRVSKENNGWIVKTIGDAFMLYFEPGPESLISALKCAKEIITQEQTYSLRIGACEGKVNEQFYEIQKVKLKDFYGTPVNAASRLESKIAEKGCIAFSSTSKRLGQKFSAFIDKKVAQTDEVDLSKYNLKGVTLQSAFLTKIK